MCIRDSLETGSGSIAHFQETESGSIAHFRETGSGSIAHFRETGSGSLAHFRQTGSGSLAHFRETGSGSPSHFRYRKCANCSLPGNWKCVSVHFRNRSSPATYWTSRILRGTLNPYETYGSVLLYSKLDVADLSGPSQGVMIPMKEQSVSRENHASQFYCGLG